MWRDSERLFLLFKIWCKRFNFFYSKKLGPYKRALIAAHHCGLRLLQSTCFRNPWAYILVDCGLWIAASHGLRLVDCGHIYAIAAIHKPQSAKCNVVQLTDCGNSIFIIACQSAAIGALLSLPTFLSFSTKKNPKKTKALTS